MNTGSSKITLEEFRNIFKNSELSDEEAEMIIDSIFKIATIVTETI